MDFELTHWNAPENSAVTVTGEALGAVTTGNCVVYPSGNWWPNGYWWPNHITYITYPIAPDYCVGLTHVFECDHARTCKCGKIVRANPKKI